MKARIGLGLLLATALAVAIVVAGCGGGSVVSDGAEPQVLNAWLEGGDGAFPDYSAQAGQEVRVLAEAPDSATSVQATFQGPEGEPLPGGGTLILLEGPWTSPATHGRGFTVPSSATTGTIYVIQVTADGVQSELFTITVGAGQPVPCLPVSAWFLDHLSTERNITAAAGATITVLALPFGTPTSVVANIQGSPPPTPSSTITLTAGGWPSPATHGGSFTIPAAATSGTIYAVSVVATFGPPADCQGTSPPLTVTVQ